ncbi:MAG: TSUP family transporter [Novosphingobium sp.]
MVCFLLRHAYGQQAWPRAEAVLLGAVTNFFDTLGIGSFAPTTAWFKFRRMVPDHLIPPTMIAGLTPPSMVQALIFLALLGSRVDPVLLFGTMIALTIGGLIGAPLVYRARVWIVQGAVGIALILAATFYSLSGFGLMPIGGTAASLSPGLTVLAIAASFVFGILLNFGIGNYAPTLAMLSLMGLDPRYCFPIMASSNALAGVIVATRHVRAGKIDLRIVLGVALGGIPAVLVAALLVKSMPLDVLRWLVTVVVLYTAVVMLRAAAASRRQPVTGTDPATGGAIEAAV